MNFALRNSRRGDEISLQKNINDKDIAENTSHIPYPYRMKDARNWVNKNLRLNKNSDEMNFVIDINGKVAGGIGFHNIDRKNRNAEIGYWLGKSYWNKGIMTKAVKKMCSIGFKKLRLVRIYAKVFTFNKASAAVLKKAGFNFEGEHNKAVYKNGKFLNNYIYARVR